MNTLHRQIEPRMYRKALDLAHSLLRLQDREAVKLKLAVELNAIELAAFGPILMRTWDLLQAEGLGLTLGQMDGHKTIEF